MKWRTAPFTLIGLVLLAMFIGLAAPLQLVLLGVGGWILYLYRIIPEVTVAPEPIAIGVVSLLALAYFGHRFAVWLYASWGASPGAREPWRPRWTLSLVALFVLIFGSVIAAAGLAHQSVWLLRGEVVRVEGVDRGKQKRTMSDMRSIGTALESCRLDQGTLPVVGDGPLGALSPFLAPTFIKLIPMQDGWKNPIYYRHRVGAESYSLISTGRDHWSDVELSLGATTSFEADIYYSDGQFTRFPEGTQD